MGSGKRSFNWIITWSGSKSGENEFQQNRPLELRRPVGDLLLPYDDG
jgi:hypothetical protein